MLVHFFSRCNIFVVYFIRATEPIPKHEEPAIIACVVTVVEVVCPGAVHSWKQVPRGEREGQTEATVGVHGLPQLESKEANADGYVGAEEEGPEEGG